MLKNLFNSFVNPKGELPLEKQKIQCANLSLIE